MKGTDKFKQTILEHLTIQALEDSVLAEAMKSASKSIDDCIKYILNTVKKSECMGFADEEIFEMARHYYLTEKVDVGGDLNCSVVVNHKVILTDEEKAEAKQKALNDYEDEIKRDERRKANVAKATKPKDKPAKMTVVKDDKPKEAEKPSVSTWINQTLF